MDGGGFHVGCSTSPLHISSSSTKRKIEKDRPLLRDRPRCAPSGSVGAGWSMFTGIGTEKGIPPGSYPEDITSTPLHPCSGRLDVPASTDDPCARAKRTIHCRNREGPAFQPRPVCHCQNVRISHTIQVGPGSVVQFRFSQTSPREKSRRKMQHRKPRLTVERA